MGLHYKRIEKIFKTIFTKKPLILENDALDIRQEIINKFQIQLKNRFENINDIKIRLDYNPIYRFERSVKLEIRYSSDMDYDDLFHLFFKEKKLILQDRTCRNEAPVSTIDQIIELLEIIPKHREELEKKRLLKREKEKNKRMKADKIYELKKQFAISTIKVFSEQSNLTVTFPKTFSRTTIPFCIKVEKNLALQFCLPIDDIKESLDKIKKHIHSIMLAANDGVHFEIVTWYT